MKDNLDLLKFSFDFLFEKLKNKLEILHYKNTFRFDSDDETTESYKDQKVIEKEVPKVMEKEVPKVMEEDIPKAKEEEVFESVKRLDDPQWWSEFIEFSKNEINSSIAFIKMGTVQLDKKITKFASMPELTKFTPETAEGFIILLQEQSHIFALHIKNRVEWVDTMAQNHSMFFSDEELIQVRDIRRHIVELHERYQANVLDMVAKHSNSPTVQTEQFYSLLNSYKKETFKDINKMDTIILQNIKDNPWLTKNKELKKLLNIEYAEAKRDFINKDSYLKMKVGEILRKKNQQ